ncbi:polysaccharide deacetylase family protein [Kriegella sp. EG-1]|nr:polysaccharide deacetylase family protein [Flavobacteriaceae bacterium EG-1]
MKPSYMLFIVLLITFSSTSQILKKPLPEKLVVLTFDDAPASQYSVVAPLLKEFGFGATFFVCEFPPNYKDSTLYMNWRQIKALDHMGFEIANHTQTHANVAKLSPKEFHKELAYIENKCDSLGLSQPTNFAYPGYGLNAEVLPLLQARGYQFARAGGSRIYNPLEDHPFLIPSWATNATNKAEIMLALNKAKAGSIVVLTLHGVPDIEHPWVDTPPELFKEYLQYLARNNFTVISLRELSAYINIEKAKELIQPDLNKALSN